MAGNSIGELFRLTTFGESHGSAIGGVIDGCPAGIKIDLDFINQQMARRSPGQSALTTSRKESDIPRFLSGIYEGKTTGTPIAFLLENKDHRPGDYDHLKDVYRPSHADYTYEKKYGHRDHRGGGRASARETACRVAAGAVAMLMLQQYCKLNISAFVNSIGKVQIDDSYNNIDLLNTDKSAVRCPHPETAEKMEAAVLKAKEEGDSLGGTVTCIVRNVPIGLGEPVFHRLEADLARAMLSINATKGFEIGSGFAGTQMRGSEHNDPFINNKDSIATASNHSGGVQGGISNGSDLLFRVAFKPVATIAQKQKTVNSDGKAVTIEAKGRHDPCVVPRAVPIVEAMAALVLADHFLRNKVAQ